MNTSFLIQWAATVFLPWWCFMDSRPSSSTISRTPDQCIPQSRDEVRLQQQTSQDHVGKRERSLVVAMASVAIAICPEVAIAADDGPSAFGIPIDFILFAVTLIGVGLFHHYTLAVALTGLATITVYKLVFTGFKAGAGLAGLGIHFAHEWVILANLLGLLVGFALLSNHFEKSHVPDLLPRKRRDRNCAQAHRQSASARGAAADRCTQWRD